MTKVCVVTLYKHNYGAFLQAYALQRFLEDLGFSAEVLNYDYYNDRTILGLYIGKIKNNPFRFLKSIAYKLSRYSVSKKRDIIMEKCAFERIKQTNYYKSYKELKSNPPFADIYIVGSDQVWNPRLQEQALLSRLLDFVNYPDSVLASYAASVGVKQFSDVEKNIFHNHLNRFDSISVRESNSVSLLSELTNKAINVNCDPALLLDANKWDCFKTDIMTSKKYVFVYLAQKSPELIKFAEELAKVNKWDIVDCRANINYEINYSITAKSILTPMEFVGGIKNASYVVTNSFHCLVFCIHYSKRAYVKIPPLGSSRLAELIENLQLERLTTPEVILEGEESLIYKNANAYLNNARNNAADYIKELENIRIKKRQADNDI